MRVPVVTLTVAVAIVAVGIGIIKKNHPGNSAGLGDVVRFVLDAEPDVKDHYKVLGVSRDAPADDIKRAYKAKALESHPDKQGDQSIFVLVNEAHEILSNPKKRLEYDQELVRSDDEVLTRVSARAVRLAVVLLIVGVLILFVGRFEALYYKAKQVEADVAAAAETARKRREVEREAMLAEVERNERRKEAEELLRKKEREVRKAEAEARRLESQRSNVEQRRQTREAQQVSKYHHYVSFTVQAKMNELRDTVGAERAAAAARAREEIAKRKEEWRAARHPNTAPGRGGENSGHAWVPGGRRLDEN